MPLSQTEMESVFKVMDESVPSQTRTAKQFILENYDFINMALRDYSIPTLLESLSEKDLLKVNLPSFRAALKQARKISGDENMYFKRHKKPEKKDEETTV